MPFAGETGNKGPFPDKQGDQRGFPSDTPRQPFGAGESHGTSQEGSKPRQQDTPGEANHLQHNPGQHSESHDPEFQEDLGYRKMIAEWYSNGLRDTDVEQIVDRVHEVPGQIAKARAFDAEVIPLVGIYEYLGPVERRVAGHDIVMLYDLLVNNRYQEVYEEYAGKLQERGESLPEDEEGQRALRVNIIKSYLGEIRGKSREGELSTAGESPTIGLDIEWKDDHDSELSRIARLTFESAGVFYVSGEYGKGTTFLSSELHTTPSIDPDMQVRELEAYYNSGGLRGDLSVHVTLGGVKLGSRHTEVMDITPISAAAGFITNPTFPEEVKKLSRDPDNPSKKLYFPMHKAREPEEMDPYGTVIHDFGIERRSCNRYSGSQESLGDLQQDMRFAHTDARSIRSVQKNPQERTETDTSLVTIRQNFRGNWNQLLEQHGSIHNPTDEERIAASIDEDPPYTGFVSDVVTRAREDPAFRDETRKLVADYEKHVRDVTGFTKK